MTGTGSVMCDPPPREKNQVFQEDARLTRTRTKPCIPPRDVSLSRCRSTPFAGEWYYYIARQETDPAEMHPEGKRQTSRQHVRRTEKIRLAYHTARGVESAGP